MKKYLLIIFCFGFLIPSGARQQSWYRCYAATIGQYPIMLHLHKLGPSVTGYYYYLRTGQPVFFTGNDTTGGDQKTRLFAYHAGPGYNQEIFTLALGETGLSGTWINKDSSTLAVSGTLANTPLKFDMLMVTGKEALRQGSESSPLATYEAATVWPADNTGPAAAIRKYIAGIFGAKENTNDIQGAIQREKERFLSAYREANKNVADSEWAEYGFTYNNDETKHLLVVYQSAEWLTLAAWHYSYMGGAHGNYATDYTVLHAKNGTAAKIEDILLPSGKKQLPGLLDKAFRRQYELTAGEKLSDGGLFDDSIAPNDNFYLTEKGIGFSYAPYEIAPYALGQIDLFVPFSLLKNYLQPGFRKKMGL